MDKGKNIQPIRKGRAMCRVPIVVGTGADRDGRNPLHEFWSHLYVRHRRSDSFSPAPRRPIPIVISRLIDSLHHRGPDGTGHAVVGRVALLHNRLAIIDLVTGDQPFFAGSATLVANGEIYNYRELRAAMPGVSFATNSDCEPPLHYWLRDGADYARELRGMYAIAIHERQQHSVTLTRDPFGIKPLYIAQVKGGIGIRVGGAGVAGGRPGEAGGAAGGARGIVATAIHHRRRHDFRRHPARAAG